MIRKTDLLKSLAIGSVLVPATGFAGGYQISERNVNDLGRAFSGGGATVDDASIVATNPAGLSFLKGTQFSLAASLVNGNVESDLEDANIEVTGVGNIPLQGDKESGNVAPSNPVIPAFYASHALNDQITLGFGAFSNFSTSTHYKKDSAASIFAVDSEITTFNLNPSMSYKLDDSLSFGFGFNAVSASATLSSGFPAFGENGVPNGSTNGVSEITGSAWGYGWNLGLMYSISDDARVSFSYRSSVATTLDGKVEFKDVPGANVEGSIFQDTDAEAKLELPAIASLSGYYAITDGIALSADVTYTQWSVFEELKVTAKEGGATITEIPEEWRDSFRGALGLTYAYDDALTLRTGIALDDSPIPNHTRTLRIPTSNMTWLSLGARYAVNQELSVDAGYSYVSMAKTKLDDERQITEGVTAKTSAETSLALHILGVQLNYSL
jgi:long-chain fatty acid transport protein